jgi:hypothetical protein
MKEARATYTGEQRRFLEAETARGRTPACPECGGVLAAAPVEPPPGVPYVRRRVWIVCGACRRSAAVDLPRG